ncbi:MAG: enterochelin esterase, partial [Gammaproteobacteria bacterium]|nr:enterochelin esterase [Gemmatimonadota bacterium]NIU73108.1 enterochelin esterase [Gammaproteobacteria bacterium]NIX21775.1 enterochelin esterase [Actinomycetota bacterium]
MVSTIVALQRPDAIGNVLSMSGSFYWKPADDPEYEWVPTRIATSPPR